MVWLGEKIRKRLHQPRFGAVIGATLAAGWGLIQLMVPLGHGLEAWSYDLPFLLRSGKIVPDVTVVLLDKKSYDELKEDPITLDRRWHALLLQRLKKAGARMVVFDVLFIDEKRRTPGDEDFFKAIRDFGAVVVGGESFLDKLLFKKLHGKPSLGTCGPIEPVRDRVAGWGLVDVAEDTDFGVRRHHPGLDRVPSLAWKAADLLGTVTNLVRVKERWLNYYSAEPFEEIAFSDAVRREPLDETLFRNKVVFVGSGDVPGFTGTEREQRRSPWTWLQNENYFLGVELHALTFSNLIHKDWLVRLPKLGVFRLLEALLIICAGAGIGYTLCLLRPWWATAAAVFFAVSVAALACVSALAFRVWFPWLIVVVAQIPVALGWSYLFNSFKSYVQTQLFKRSLELVLPPKQVQRMLSQPELLKPGAEPKTVTILFSDISNFSKISERMDGQDLVRLLNDYFETTISCISHEFEGTIMNLVGDAVFALWNAPQDQPDHAERACRAALRMSQQLLDFDATHHRLPLRTRVGLHTGTVSIGYIGSKTRFSYTAIGEAVNMASRLEGLNKHLGTNMLATRDLQKLVETKMITRLVGYFRFKGFDQVVEIHELIGAPEADGDSKPWRDSFGEALHQFHRCRFDAAEAGFRRTMELRPEDGPSQFYLQRVSEMRLDPPSPEWTGEIELRDK